MEFGSATQDLHLAYLSELVVASAVVLREAIPSRRDHRAMSTQTLTFEMPRSASLFSFEIAKITRLRVRPASYQGGRSIVQKTGPRENLLLLFTFFGPCKPRKTGSSGSGKLSGTRPFSQLVRGLLLQIGQPNEHT
jgi:hypothetical protein